MTIQPIVDRVHWKNPDGTYNALVFRKVTDTGLGHLEVSVYERKRRESDREMLASLSMPDDTTNFHNTRELIDYLTERWNMSLDMAIILARSTDQREAPDAQEA
jgi:hypothetical protein